jgi:hypothetical protein
MSGKRTIAYFSIEIGLVAGMPTYSGGVVAHQVYYPITNE